jgi:hypothetical protein
VKGLGSKVSEADERPTKGTRGVFFCYALPVFDKEKNEFSELAGTTRWYLFDMEKNAIVSEPGEIIENLRCKPNTERRCIVEQKTLKDIRARVLKHIKDSSGSALERDRQSRSCLRPCLRSH